MSAININDREFSQFQKLIYQLAGINFSQAKKALVSGRLAKRLALYNLDSYGDYFKLLTAGSNSAELQVAVDLLTTNETCFFREPKHFDFLRSRVLDRRTLAKHRPGNPFRVWSAACSSGEEPYSIAMVLGDHFGDVARGDGPWEVLASDISTRMLEKGRIGHYPMCRAEGISHEHRIRYCLKGVGAQENTLLMDEKLRGRVNFMQVNLNQPLPGLGAFDVIFLRNVMIYFDLQTKRQIVGRVLPLLRPGGHLLVGHSESLNGVVDELHALAPSIYRKP
jgi:chemotaxis protein methyltransferase CheR